MSKFIKGMDLSTLLELERCGAKYYEDGKEKDILDIMKEHDVDTIRLRLWNDPKSEEGEPYGAGNNDLAETIAIGKKVTDAGFGVLLNFHYSDFFADPSRQNTPAEWAGLDLKGLSAKVAEHTKDVLTALKSAGVTPHWVQVGNETRPGMLWETGRLYNDKGDIPGGWSNYAALTTAGYDAVKSVFPDAQVIVHIDNAYQDNTWFFDKLKANGGKFDMIGLSHYPMTNSQMTWKAMNSAAILNIKTLASKYGCKVMVCEVGVKASASEIATSTQCLTDFMNSVKSLSVCAGVFYWEPQVDGKWRPAIYEKQGRNWGAYDMGAFTSDGSAITPTSILSAFGE